MVSMKSIVLLGLLMACCVMARPRPGSRRGPRGPRPRLCGYQIGSGELCGNTTCASRNGDVVDCVPMLDVVFGGQNTQLYFCNRTAGEPDDTEPIDTDDDVEDVEDDDECEDEEEDEDLENANGTENEVNERRRRLKKPRGPKRGGDRSGPKFSPLVKAVLKRACEVTNTTSDEVLRNRTCPDGAPCTSEAMEISDGNQQLTARFCAVTVDSCLRGKERGPCNSGERRQGRKSSEEDGSGSSSSIEEDATPREDRRNQRQRRPNARSGPRRI